MSPEQAKGESTSTSGDMYSLGLSLQWLFSEKDPYPGNITRTGLMIKAMRGDSLPLEGQDANLTELINRMKNVAPHLRPTAVESLDRLKWIQEAPRRKLKRLVALAFVALLVLGTTLSTVGFVKARNSAREAVQAREHTKAVNAFLNDMLAHASRSE